MNVKLTELVLRVQFLCEDPRIAGFVCTRPQGSPSPLQQLVEKISWRNPPKKEPFAEELFSLLEHLVGFVEFRKQAAKDYARKPTHLERHNLDCRVTAKYRGVDRAAAEQALTVVENHLRMDILPELVDLLHGVLVRGDRWVTDSVCFQGIPNLPGRPGYICHGHFNRLPDMVNGRPHYKNPLTGRFLYYSNSRSRWEITTQEGSNELVEAFCPMQCDSPEATTGWHIYAIINNHTRGFVFAPRVVVRQPPSGMRDRYQQHLIRCTSRLMEVLGVTVTVGGNIMEKMGDLLHYAIDCVRRGEDLRQKDPASLFFLCSLPCTMAVSQDGAYDVMYECVSAEYFSGFIKGFHLTATRTISQLHRVASTSDHDPRSFPALFFFKCISQGRAVLFSLLAKLRAGQQPPRSFMGVLGSTSAAALREKFEDGLEQLDEQIGEYVALRMYSLFLDAFGKFKPVVDKQFSNAVTAALAHTEEVSQRSALAWKMVNPLSRLTSPFA